MKVNGVPRVGGVNPYSRQEPKQTEVKGKREGRKDEVNISPQAQELLEAQGAASDLRAQKLHEIKTALSNGTYQVEARQIAEKLFPYIKS